MQGPAGGVDPAWLDLRAPADVHARTTYAAHLAARLEEHLAERAASTTRPVRLVDVGAGTGTGARWLRERISLEQEWRLVDHDPSLLGLAPPVTQGWARAVAADATDLARLLADEPADAVTCQALVDILTPDQLEAVLAPAAATRAGVLLSLSVTGEVELSPGHHADRLLAAAFDEHQRRDGRLGPDGGACAARWLRRHGYAVATASTPWHLDGAESALLAEWAAGRVEAAREQQPDLGPTADDWLSTRNEQLRDGVLRAVVGHVDVLGLPVTDPAP